jgi:hypothetical protein
MTTQPAFDRGILFPLFIGGFSVIGIVAVLLIGRSLNTPAEVPMTPSATRFQYVFLGTEPAITTPIIEDTEIPITDGPTEQPVATSGSVTPIQTATPTPIILATATTGTQQTNTAPPPTATSQSAPPLNPGTYDDVDANLVYNGWNATNFGGTLHVSTVPGSTISFRFIGRRMRLLYQGGSTLGQIRITIDNSVSETLDQSSGNEWVSELLANGTHLVLITHVGGGSVNLDQVVIQALVSTATPTQTPNQN